MTYTFDELDDSAKDRARDWWRECEDDDNDWSCTYEDVANIADLIGIDLRQRPVKLMNGSTRYEPCIWFRGFSSQGDGACFEGNYSYKKGSCKLVREYAPRDKKLHHIVDELASIQKRHFYRLEAIVKHREHYYHSGCTDIDVFDRDDNHRDFKNGDDEEIAQSLRDFMDWIYSQLESEYEFKMSDENVDESIRINEYTFDEEGHRESL